MATTSGPSEAERQLHSRLQEVVGERMMTREDVDGESRRPAEQAAWEERERRAHMELQAAKRRAEQNHKDNFEKPILDVGAPADVDADDGPTEGGVGHSKKHKAATRSTAAGRGSAASSSTTGATPKVTQRALKRHDSVGSDCKKCMDADFIAAAKPMEQEKEPITDVEMIAEAPPPWMITLQTMMNAQTDKMMATVGMNTNKSNDVEVKLDRNYTETQGKFERIEKRLHDAESHSKAQIASIEDRVQRLEIGGASASKEQPQPQATAAWVPRHAILGVWPDCTPREEIVRNAEAMISRLPEDAKRICLCKIRVRPGGVEAVTFTIQQFWKKAELQHSPRWAAVECNPAARLQQRRLRDATQKVNSEFPMRDTDVNAVVYSGGREAARFNDNTGKWEGKQGWTTTSVP